MMPEPIRLMMIEIIVEMTMRHLRSLALLSRSIHRISLASGARWAISVYLLRNGAACSRSVGFFFFAFVVWGCAGGGGCGGG